MTHADIFCKISRKPPAALKKVFRRMLAGIPANKRGKLDQPCPDAPALLAHLARRRVAF